MPTDPVVAPLTFGAFAAWLALVAIVSAFAAWGITEIANRKFLRPWKASLRAKGIEPGWWWVAVVGGVSVLVGTLAGTVLGGATPIDSEAVGAVVGLGSGASPAWIVRWMRSKASGVALPGGEG